jgi:hypothetical protein
MAGRQVCFSMMLAVGGGVAGAMLVGPAGAVATLEVKHPVLDHSVVNRPGHVHAAFTWLQQCVNEGFFYDGMCKEGSPSYRYMTVGGLRGAFRHLEGYTGAPGRSAPSAMADLTTLTPKQSGPDRH